MRKVSNMHSPLPRPRLLFASWWWAGLAVLIFLAALLGIAPIAAAQPVKTPHVEAELIARHTTFQPGQPIEAALRLKIIDHWHTYWRNPGDSGLPTRLKWTLPDGFVASEIAWPFPKKLALGSLMIFGYEGEVLHLVTIQTPSALQHGESVTLKAKADWLVCADVCIPEDGVVALSMAASNVAPALNAKWQRAFTEAHAALPSKTLEGVSVVIDGMSATITATTNSAWRAAEVAFFPHRDDVMANAAKQTFAKTANGFSLTIALADPRNNTLTHLDGVLVAGDGKSVTHWSQQLSARAVAVSAPVTYRDGADTKQNTSTSAGFQPKMPGSARTDLSLAMAVLLALLGGLILNLMPCVFPVLGIKVMGFVATAHGESRLLRRQGVAYCAGVLASFMLLAGLMLALRSAGQAVGWGFQMQEPLVIAALAVMFFLMALNLSGLFEFGTSLQVVAGEAERRAQSDPLRGAFVSGVLATVVATPCMAPGLGASVGFTLGQSAPMALLIFAAIATGLALPVLLLAFFPASLRYLPKPGAWMQTFKQAMAFPLYATVVWLIWVLGSQTGNDGAATLLLALTLLALGAWMYGRWQATKTSLAISVVAIAVVAGLGAAWHAATTAPPASAAATTSADDWQPYSKEKIATLRREGKSVFVDFTATWCITCQVNKRVALNDDKVIQQMRTRNVVRMRADWTRRDETITAALAEFGRNGVPLYVFYPPTGEARVLPELLTPGIVLDAIASK